MTGFYSALVVKIQDVKPIKGADFIAEAIIGINNITVAHVIVANTVSAGEYGLFFCAGSQIAESFAQANNLLAVYDSEGNKTSGGYLDEKRKIRAQRFKGVRSEGLWMSFKSLSYLFESPQALRAYTDSLVEGDRVQSVRGTEICRRFALPSAKPEKLQPEKVQDSVMNFPPHYKTPQLAYCLQDLEHLVGARLIITEKLHGTSMRTGRVPVRVQGELPLWKKIVNKCNLLCPWLPKFVLDSYTFDLVYGSRRTILDDSRLGFYGTHAFRYESVGRPDLLENEVIYGEIVGWINEETPIMPDQDTKELKDVKALFGASMRYTYGQPQGTCKHYVYRITQMDAFGVIHDLPHAEVKRRASQLGYETPTVIFEEENWTGDIQALLSKVQEIVEPNGYWCKSTYGDHIMEGVVILFEKNGQVYPYKHKGIAFKILEGIAEVPTGEEES